MVMQTETTTPGWPLGESDLGRIDESGSHVWPGPLEPYVHRLPGRVAGPIAGASLAVLLAFVLRGRGGGGSGSGAAQGDLFTEVYQEGS
jgi:hypothetical protein